MDGIVSHIVNIYPDQPNEETEDAKYNITTHKRLELNSEDTLVKTERENKSKENSIIPLCNRQINDEDKIFCSKYKNIYIKSYCKKPHGKRPYDKVHSCAFCGKLLTNIQGHLENMHSNESQVKEIKALLNELKLEKRKPSSPNLQALKVKIQHRQDCLRNKGNHYHNKQVFIEKKGELLVSRRSTKEETPFFGEDYQPCAYCYNWIIISKNADRHSKVCPAKLQGQARDLIVAAETFSRKLKLDPDALCTDGLREEVLPRMLDDEISAIAKGDRLILHLGDIWLSKSNSDNKVNSQTCASFHMRLAARLLALLRKASGEENKTMSEFLNPEYFKNCVSAAVTACKMNENDDMKHPTTAIRLGHDIKRLLAAKIGIAIGENDTKSKAAAHKFLSLMKSEWKWKFSKRVSQLVHERNLNKREPLPYPEDIRVFSHFLINLLEECDYETDSFRSVSLKLMTYLLCYNKRRPGEIENLSLEHCKVMADGIDDISETLRGQLTATELYIAESQNLVCVPGKGGCDVPILIPNLTKPAMDFLTNNDIRLKNGIKQDNHYLFPNKVDGPLRCSDALRIMVSQVSLQAPERLTSTNCRKYLATITQVFSLEENELKYVTQHLGRTLKEHGSHFRAPGGSHGSIDKIEVGKLMMIADNNLMHLFRGKKLTDIQFEDLVENENIDELEDSHSEEKPINPKKKRKLAEKRNHQKWTCAEVQEINKYLSLYLKKKKTPNRKACKGAIAASKLHGGVLQHRKPDTIKKKVSNLLKKQK